MGVLKDLGTSITCYIDEKTNYPTDEYDHLLNKFDPWDNSLVPNWDRPGTELYNLTSPYGHLHFAVGSGDDFYCFDYAFVDDWVVLHSVLNSETGSFIQDIDYRIDPKHEAAVSALDMVDEALEWCGENEVRHNKSGWNQDPYFFYRSLFIDLAENPPDFSDRQLRLGGKRINKFVGLI